MYDPAYQSWPPHINLIYPFVPVAALDRAMDKILAHFKTDGPSFGSTSIHISLDSVGEFAHKHSKTIYMYDSNPTHTEALVALRLAILHALGIRDFDRDSQLHMSIASVNAKDVDMGSIIFEKVRLSPAITWSAGQLVVLRRITGPSLTTMQFWKCIDLEPPAISCEPGNMRWRSQDAMPELGPPLAVPRKTYEYCDIQQRWTVMKSASGNPKSMPDALVVASYNVLAEFTWPPCQDRYPFLIQNLLAKTAQSDIIVLQEVTDDFLSTLLRDGRIRLQYPISSHGPPDQDDLEPLPSLLNQVVLSRIPFSWEQLPLKSCHKTSVIANFQGLEAPGERSLILATCHLSRGLTDGAVTAKLAELQRITDHLRNRWGDHPWIIAGDFNIATSRMTIKTALENRAVSKQLMARMCSVDDVMRDFGLIDAWMLARCGAGESSDDLCHYKDVWDSFEGEQGATFDPTENDLAAKMVGDGASNRPQRYDRIFVKPRKAFAVAGFNIFGFPSEGGSEGQPHITAASDHWGIRCLLCRPNSSSTLDSSGGSLPNLRPVFIKHCGPGLDDTEVLRTHLQNLGRFPTEIDEIVRSQAFATLESTIMDAFGRRQSSTNSQTEWKMSLVVAVVGSYALGTWDKDSDIDCLCIGPFSSQSFFSVVIPYFRRSGEIKIMRKVKANTGFMLELEVHEIRVDLQYCGAASIAER